MRRVVVNLPIVSEEHADSVFRVSELEYLGVKAIKKGKGKGKIHRRTGHEGQEVA